MRINSPTRRRASAAITCLVSASMILTGCASDEEAAGVSGGAAVSVDEALAQAASEKAAELTAGIDLDPAIELLGMNSGTEGAVLQRMYKSFTDGTGVAVNYTGTSDAPSIAEARLQSGNPVDLLTTQIGVMARYAQQGKLVNLSSYMEDELEKNYSPALLDSVRVNGSIHGVFQGFNNFMLWFNPSVYSGPESPEATWDDVSEWADEAAQAGNTPWCLPMEAGASTGFPGRQVVEILFLKKYGPEMYSKLGSGELPWTSPEVKDAFEMLGDMTLDASKLLGGPRGALSSPTATGDAGLITDPPQCQATVWGSWTAGLVSATGTVEPGVNLDFIPVPPSNPDFARYENYQAEFLGAFKDTPTIRAFLEYVQSTEAQALLASADQWTVANVNVSPQAYDSPLLERAAERYFGSDVELVSGPNVMMTTAVKNAVQSGIVTYLTDSSQLDSVLSKIQTAQNESR
ncbi:ABC transporter substrate-binding protein (plasmid) [Rhodococcus erythropolis]|uniref:ABC transporter substrate-binding protein n=1 Tax=Rhodococcus erythropolis TaxID=1833 RepID=UPI00406BB59F